MPCHPSKIDQARSRQYMKASSKLIDPYAFDAKHLNPNVNV